MTHSSAHRYVDGWDHVAFSAFFFSFSNVEKHTTVAVNTLSNCTATKFPSEDGVSKV